MEKYIFLKLIVMDYDCISSIFHIFLYDKENEKYLNRQKIGLFKEMGKIFSEDSNKLVKIFLFCFVQIRT